MHGSDSRSYLGEEFLDRVQRAYRLALEFHPQTRGMWRDFDRRRADIHDALLADNRSPLREIFADPIKTDLYYGVDNLCASVGAVPPNAGFLELALTNDRGYSAQYQVQRLLELLNETRERSIVEIGPGMGRTAYYAYRAGITNYTTIDLPLGIVAQACFLGRALGPDKLWFFGEDEREVDCVKLLPAGQLPLRHYGVALNVDSLSEMPAAEAFSYATWLSNHAKIFLSINHPKNLFTVDEVMKWTGNSHLLLQSECPTWPGYMEGVYSNCDRAAAVYRWRRYAFRLLVAMRYITRRIAARLS